MDQQCRGRLFGGKGVGGYVFAELAEGIGAELRGIGAGVLNHVTPKPSSLNISKPSSPPPPKQTILPTTS